MTSKIKKIHLKHLIIYGNSVEEQEIQWVLKLDWLVVSTWKVLLEETEDEGGCLGWMVMGLGFTSCNFSMRIPKGHLIELCKEEKKYHL